MALSTHRWGISHVKELPLGAGVHSLASAKAHDKGHAATVSMAPCTNHHSNEAGADTRTSSVQLRAPTQQWRFL